MKFWFDSSITDFDSDEGLSSDNPFEMKRINIIVGSNNSGKSRFMRQLAYEFYSHEYSSKNDIILDVSEYLSKEFLENNLEKVFETINDFTSIENLVFPQHNLLKLKFKQDLIPKNLFTIKKADKIAK